MTRAAIYTRVSTAAQAEEPFSFPPLPGMTSGQCKAIWGPSGGHSGTEPPGTRAS
jgi:hypothetical protein